MKSKTLPLVILTIIIIFGFFVRIYNVRLNPVGFFADEAAIGYNAYSLLKTGADEYGKPFPFFFRSFGDFRNPLPIYLNIPMVALFGLNEFSVRATSAISGTLTILLVYAVAINLAIFKKPFLNNFFALTSAFFLAISPWHIHFSRFGSEYIYFPFMLTLSWWLFLKGLKNQKLLPISFLSFGITLYTYYPTWLITPLFVISLLFLYRNVLGKNIRITIFSIIIFLISCTPLIIGIKSGIALTRWQNVAITKETQSSLPLIFAKNYLNHFSPTFLFTKGDIDYPGHFIRRFSSRGVGELYLFELPLILLGALAILLYRNPAAFSIGFLLLLYPLGSSLAATDGGAPLAFRSIIGTLPLTFLAALGISLTINKFQNKLLSSSIMAILILLSVSGIIVYLKEYHTKYPSYSSDFWGWQFGPRDVMKYFLSVKDYYDDLFLMGDFNSPEIFIKFYDPKNVCQEKCTIAGIEKYNPTRRQLYAISNPRQKEIPPNLKMTTKKIVYYPDNTPAFLIGELVKI
jgi:4-amino-4-deoxy-L-arabinose transferase-like glycosyltransferase